MTLTLNIVVASTRPGREGPKIGDWAHRFAAEHGRFDVRPVDLKDYDLPLLDEPNHPSRGDYRRDHTKRWSEVNEAADAFVFIVPEYDYFPAASFVNAIQSLHREWRRKPAGLVGYGGVSGGLRAMQTERILLSAVNIMPVAQEVPIPFFSRSIGRDGVFRPAPEVEQGMTIMLEELHRWAEPLARMRREQAA